MEICEIKWTQRAKIDLHKVYSFYTELAGEETAFKIIEELLSKVEILSDQRFVDIGAVDDQFAHLKRNYKKLIHGDIKVTYRQSSDKTKVYVNRVFHARQNPNKNR